MSFAPAMARLRWNRCRGVPHNARCCNTYAPEPKTSNAIGCVGQKLRKQTARSIVPPNVDSRYRRALIGGSNPGADEWPESALRRHPTVVDDDLGPPPIVRTARQQPRVSGLTRLMPKNIPIGMTHCQQGEE